MNFFEFDEKLKKYDRLSLERTKSVFEDIEQIEEYRADREGIGIYRHSRTRI